MSENPHLRSIRIFDPRVDLSEDKRTKPARSVETGGDLFEELQSAPGTTGTGSHPAQTGPSAGGPSANAQKADRDKTDQRSDSSGLDVVEDESMEIIDL